MLRSGEAVEWLAALVESAATPDAVAAVEALRSYRSDTSLAARVRAAVSGRRSRELEQAMEKSWGA
jgi:MoxR-like ATPase